MGTGREVMVMRRFGVEQALRRRAAGWPQVCIRADDDYGYWGLYWVGRACILISMAWALWLLFPAGFVSATSEGGW
jgi:hypothetical protein